MEKFTKKVLSVALAACLAGIAGPGVAFAEQTTVGSEAATHVILAGDSDIEKLSEAVEDAQAELDGAAAKAVELQEEIDEVESQLPGQQARADAGVRQRYIMQSNPLVVADALIASGSLGEFLRQIEYLDVLSQSGLHELNRLKELEQRLGTAREKQQAVIADAQAAADEAEAALSAEQDKRARAQRDGIGEAELQAREQGGEKSVGVAYDGGEQPKDYKEAATQDTAALSDGADWHAGREAFIAEWAPRIDAYLAGSALAGQGENFAAAAWKHGVDPRWSPAISNTESSKGAVCIRPHNAWGWGAADSDPYGLASEWASWEEAIDAHVAGLAKGYGYTISMNNAKRYCPNTWQSWYNKTLAQMAQI